MPRHKKLGFLHMRKHGRRSAAQLISALVFATKIVQFLYLLKPTFQASSHLRWFVSDLVGNPEDRFSRDAARIS